MSVQFLMKMSYCLLVCGIAGMIAAVVLYRKLEISRAWHILFAVPLPQKMPKRVPQPQSKPAVLPAQTRRLLDEDTVILYEETMIHTSEVI